MREKVLILDDEVDICQVFKDLLEFEERDDYDVDYVTTADEGLKRLSAHPYAVLFIDIKLSGTISGIDIIKHCRKLHPVPTIVVISAIPEKSLDPIFRQEGIQDLICAFYEKTDALTPQVILDLMNQLFKKEKKENT